MAWPGHRPRSSSERSAGFGDEPGRNTNSFGLAALRDSGRGRGGPGASGDDGSLCRKRDSSRTPSRGGRHRRDRIAGRIGTAGPAGPGLRRDSDRPRNPCDRVRMGASLAASSAHALRVVLGASGEGSARFATKRRDTRPRPGFSVLIIAQTSGLESRPRVSARGRMSHRNRRGEVVGFPDSTGRALVRAGRDGIRVALPFLEGPSRTVPWPRSLRRC